MASIRKGKKPQRLSDVSAVYDYLIFFSVALAIVLIDQVSKHMMVGIDADIFAGIVSFRYVENTGAGFGMMKGYTGFLIFFSIIVLGIILFLLDLIRSDQLSFISLALIFGGTFGNLIDRVMLGHVIDFIDLAFWPVFNIADSAISAGYVILIFCIIRDRRIRRSTKPHA